MNVGSTKEQKPEKRISITPEISKKYIKAGFEVFIENNIQTTIDETLVEDSVALETFGNNLFFWQGIDWFEKVVNSERFYNALGRQFLYTGIILFIEIPLGIAIALTMPKKGIGVSFCLVLMSIPLLIPWNVVGAMWNIFALPDIGLLGYGINNWLNIMNNNGFPFAEFELKEPNVSNSKI